MLWKKGRRSDNVVDARGDDMGGGGGMRFGGGKGLSLGAILLIVGIGWITGQDPLQILGQLTGQMTEQSAPTSQTRQAPPANDEQAEFVRSILGDTEDTWGAIFQQAGRQYKDPTLVLFSNRVGSLYCRPACWKIAPQVSSVSPRIERTNSACSSLAGGA